MAEAWRTTETLPWDALSRTIVVPAMKVVGHSTAPALVLASP